MEDVKKAEKVVATMDFEHSVFGKVEPGMKFAVNFRETIAGGSGVLYLIDKDGIFGKASEVAFERAPNSPLPSPEKLKDFVFSPMKIPENFPLDERLFRVKVFLGGEKLLNVRTGDLLQFIRTLDDFMRVDYFKNLRTGEVGKYPRDFCIEISQTKVVPKSEKIAIPKYNINVSGVEIKKGANLVIVEIANGGNTLKVETIHGEIVHLPSILFSICSKTKRKEGEEEVEGEKNDQDDEEGLPLPPQEIEKFRRVERVVESKRNEMISMLLQIEQLKKLVKSKHRELEVTMKKAKEINPLYQNPSIPGDVVEGSGEEELECKECFERKVDVSLQCGHVICKHCYSKAKRKESLCPWCKSYLTEAKKLFVET